MITWRHKMEIHVVCPDLLCVCRRYFVVKDLVFWEYPLVSHSLQCPALVQYHPPLCIVIHWFTPGGVTINFVEDNLICIPLARSVRELPCLVRVYISLGSYIVKKKSRRFYSGRNLTSLISCIFCWESTLVDYTPCI